MAAGFVRALPKSSTALASKAAPARVATITAPFSTLRSATFSRTCSVRDRIINNRRTSAFHHLHQGQTRGFAHSSIRMSTLEEIKANCKKILCIGRNYADHVKELNNQRPKQPFFFLKPSTSILLPNEGPVLRPEGINLHFEIELGIVIGKTLKDVDENDEKTWMDAIDCWLLTIDMTGRNLQEEAKRTGLPWSIAKGFDTWLPIAGPIEKSKIPDPHKVDIWLSVNGDVKQSDNTELMLFRIGRQLSDISKVMTLEKGDIVITGTPKGVGPVVTGDVMTAGLKVDGKELPEAAIKVEVKDSPGAYVFTPTY